MPGELIRILVLEDDPAMAAGIVRGLSRASFSVELVNTGVAARDALFASPAPDLAVVDLMVPEMSGLELLEYAQDRSNVPIIVLTASTSLEERLRCFRMGAIDFLPKPFWMEELVERIHTRLRKRPAEQRSIVQWANVEVDCDARTVVQDKTPIAFTRTEFNVLAYLITRKDRAFSRLQLAERCLASTDGSADERTIDTYIARIRKKLGPAGLHITTVWGIGYRFVREEK